MNEATPQNGIPESKSCFVGIFGRPNVGKSSLMNALVGEKVAIVSEKPQTTRTKITGVLTQGATQFVFLDTPGLHRRKSKLSDYMNQQVTESVADVDVAVLVTEAMGEIREAEKTLLESFEKLHMPVILVLNKVDALEKKDDLIVKIADMSSRYEFGHVIPASAKTGENVPLLLEKLEEYACEGPHFFPDDAMTDQPERVIVAEIIREKLLRNLSQEIPHGTAVVVDSIKERENGEITDIQAVIYCERASHKGMIIGKGGAMLKKIATQARQDAEDFLGIHMNLQCWVKVKDDWRNHDVQIKNMGYR
ncbi:MAG: GTPase Era [Oscillospiraceae bacterium]